MDKKGLVVILLLSFLLISCAGGNSGNTSKQLQDRKVPELLATIPSDALAVACYDKCSEAVMLLDSTSVFRMLDLSQVSSRKASIALCFNGALTPLLAIEAISDSRDSVSVVENMMQQARSLKLQSVYFSPEDIGSKHGAIVITSSESQLAAIKRHVAGGTSIMDAQNFRNALNASGNSNDFIILKAAGADRYLPKKFLGGRFGRRDLSSFIKTVTEWIVAIPQGGNSFSIVPVQNNSDIYYANAMESMPVGDSKLSELIPSTTTFALSIPMETVGFRQEYEKYLDANVKLEKYTSRLNALKKGSGKDPLKWEKELGVREVAIVSWEGHDVILVRPAKAVKDKHVAENSYRGFISALYGQVFSTVDDSHCAQALGWYIFGSELDVNEFILCDERADASKQMLKSGHLMIYEPETALTWTKKGIKWNSSL